MQVPLGELPEAIFNIARETFGSDALTNVVVEHVEDWPIGPDGHEGYLLYGVVGPRFVSVHVHGPKGGDAFVDYAKAIALSNIDTVEVKGDRGTIWVNSEKGMYSTGIAGAAARQIIRTGYGSRAADEAITVS